MWLREDTFFNQNASKQCEISRALKMNTLEKESK